MRALTPISACSTPGCGRPTLVHLVARIPYEVRCACGKCPGERLVGEGFIDVSGGPHCERCCTGLDPRAVAAGAPEKLLFDAILAALAQDATAHGRSLEGHVFNVTAARSRASLHTEPLGETS